MSRPLAATIYSVLAFVCIVYGLGGWLYQGYTEDSGSPPVQSWPIGLAGCATGWLFVLAAVRLGRPQTSREGMVRVATLLAAALAGLALWLGLG